MLYVNTVVFGNISQRVIKTHYIEQFQCMYTLNVHIKAIRFLISMIQMLQNVSYSISFLCSVSVGS